MPAVARVVSALSIAISLSNSISILENASYAMVVLSRFIVFKA
jgi:hypothetical protein